MIVDFTNRDGLLDLAKKASPLGIHIVSGSTGLLDKDYQVLKNLVIKILLESYLHQFCNWSSTNDGTCIDCWKIF